MFLWIRDLKKKKKKVLKIVCNYPILSTEVSKNSSFFPLNLTLDMIGKFYYM